MMVTIEKVKFDHLSKARLRAMSMKSWEETWWWWWKPGVKCGRGVDDDDNWENQDWLPERGSVVSGERVVLGEWVLWCWWWWWHQWWWWWLQLPERGSVEIGEREVLGERTERRLRDVSRFLPPTREFLYITSASLCGDSWADHHHINNNNK